MSNNPDLQAENGMDKYDKMTLYCRILGHQIPFSYCRKPGKKLFCKNILNCWTGTIDIEGYIKEFYSEKEISEAFKASDNKIVSLVELINKTRGKLQ